MTEHKFARESTGSGIADTVTAVCSCGWRGIPRPGYDDWQLTNVRMDEHSHRQDIAKELKSEHT